MEHTTTIAAISTPLAAGGIGIVRLSGPEAIAVAGRVFRPAGDRRLETLKGYSSLYGTVWDGEEKLDEAIAAVYRGPRSYTGEDVVELNCHSGLYLLRRVLRACLERGARPAGPGEFTRRAFLNGKMDLSQAEAVMELIGAQNSQGLRAALSAREGRLSREIQAVKEGLLSAAASLAAWADYPEEDLPAVENGQLLSDLEGWAGSLRRLLEQSDRGKVFRGGIDTVIAGRPNVGKSTLMNLLAGTRKSIVTDIPGTTRDVVEEQVALGDYILNLADTAGLRESRDPVERLGVQSALDRLEGSLLVLAVFDASEPLTAEDRKLAEYLQGRQAVAVFNKADLPRRLETEELRELLPCAVELSAARGEGVPALEEAIGKALGAQELDLSLAVLVSERQRDAAVRALSALEEAARTLAEGFTLDAVHIWIEEAAACLMELTGERVTDAVVEQVFARFCVGK